MGHGSSAVWRDRDPAFGFFSGVPFGLFGPEHAGWLRFGGGQELWERAYEPFGILPLYAGSFGVLAAGWFRNPLAGPETVKDMVMRTDGLNGEIWRRLGVQVVNVPWDDVLPAFSDGKLDAAEWMGPRSERDLDMSTVAKNYYMPGFSGLGRAIELIVNRSAFDALPEDLRAVVQAAAAAAAADTYADFAFNNIAFLKPLAQSGVSVRSLPDALVVAAGIEAEALLREIAAQSPVAGETYESFIAFRAGAIDFGASGDGEALRMRALALAG
jgi:TRAP-type mannitol/chloroaromatic compound transport system substrate-binding protein